jgi:hypothetical protein
VAVACDYGIPGASLQPARYNQNDENQEKQSQAAARVIPPAGTIGPSRQTAEKKQNEEDQEYGSDHAFSPHAQKYLICCSGPSVLGSISVSVFAEISTPNLEEAYSRGFGHGSLSKGCKKFAECESVPRRPLHRCVSLLEARGSRRYNQDDRFQR